jgi:hypothetical protein
VQALAAETWNTTTPAQGTSVVVTTTTLGTVMVATRLSIQAGLQVFSASGAPTGGDQGPGTINVAGTGVASAPAYLLNGVPQGRIVQAVSWIAGANPANGFVYRADAARTIISAIGVVTAANGAAANVVVNLKPAGGGALVAIHSGAGMDCNAAAFASGDQVLPLTTFAMAAGDRLVLTTSGTFTNSAGGVQVTLQ